VYPKLILNSLDLPKLRLAVERGVDSPITRYTTELHLPLDARLRLKDTDDWRTFVVDHIPRLEAISALAYFALFPQIPGVPSTQAHIHECLVERVRRLRTRVPFTLYMPLGVVVHGVIEPALANLTHLHLAIGWDASATSVSSLSSCTALTHVLVDRMAHETYYTSRTSAIVGIVGACLKAPVLQRVLVRYPPGLKLAGVLLNKIKVRSDKMKIWVDDKTYPIDATDAIDVHLSDSLDGEAAFLRGRRLYAER